MKNVLVALAIIIILSVVALIIGLAFIWVPPRTVSLSGYMPSDEYLLNSGLTFHTTSSLGYAMNRYVRDKGAVEEFAHLIKGKTATRISDAEDKRVSSEVVYAVELDTCGKGTVVRVLKDGRIALFVPVSEYRDRSLLHKLHWKINNFGSSYAAIPYLTEPDPAVARMASKLFKIAVPPER
jgi:hypothetical protein